MTGDDGLGVIMVINIVAGILGVMFDTSKENTFREKVFVFFKYTFIWPYTLVKIIYYKLTKQSIKSMRFVKNIPIIISFH